MPSGQMPSGRMPSERMPSGRTDADRMDSHQAGRSGRQPMAGQTGRRMSGQTPAGEMPAGEMAAGQRGRHETRAGDSVTRYEEDLDVGTRDVEAGRVRLVKHTVTEQKDVSVPVTHEEVRVVREAADGSPTGRAFTEEEAEVTLRRQEPVVEKKAKPVEKVRLEKESMTEQQQVRGQVRKERVDVERDDKTRRRDS
jgi:uncharacterized protein (TIGR02271 family)